MLFSTVMRNTIMNFCKALYYQYYDKPPVMESDMPDLSEEQINESKEKRL